MGKGPAKLTDREYKVMEVLWNSEKDLTINEISELSDDRKLTVACIAQVIPRLLKKELIRVEKFIPVNTKYARTFRPEISREDYSEGELLRLLQKTGTKAIISALVNFTTINTDKEFLQDLEASIEEYIRKKKG